MTSFLDFYSRKDVQKAIVEAARNREVAVKYPTGGFGKRPDILNFENDVFELAKQGATSFHISEEHWSNPLLLKPGMTKNQLDKLRQGWDLIIDVDTKFLEYSKITASLLVEALKFHNIKNIGLKFSGGSGFHLGIPFQSLPEQVNNTDIKLLFPDAPKAIAIYLKEMIKPQLKDKILEISSLQEISKSLNKKQEELMENNEFNPFSIVEIDTVLISNRHMYRAPFSINEKRGLVSIPIQISELKNFNLKKARIENIKSTPEFLPTNIQEKEASQLIIQAFDSLDKRSFEEKIRFKKDYTTPKTAISPEFFPPCIDSIFKGIKSDGRKRALFILINFLKSTGYPHEEIEKLIQHWNQKNYQPLPQNYIQAQLSWHKRQEENILPPNCDNENYYKALGINCPDCTSKNPVNYTKRKFFAHLKHKPKRRRK